MGRGTEKGLVILNKDNFINKTKNPEPMIQKIIRFGNGWIEVVMSDGQAYRRTGGTISWRYNNPGNLKYGPFARDHWSIGEAWGGHAVFPNYHLGREAKKILLFSQNKKYHKLSIIQALSYYAPVSDGNNPNRYATFIASKLGVTINTILMSLTNKQKDLMIDNMEVYEGFKIGRIEKI